MWQVKMLKENKSTAAVITVLKERHFSNEMAHMLMANASSVNLFECNRYFLYLAMWMSKIVGNDRLHRVVLNAFLSRCIDAYFQSKHSGNTNSFLQKLDLLERNLFSKIKQH